MIRTLFGEIAAKGNFSKPLDELLQDEAWCKAVELEGGPFCYAPGEIDIPF